MLAFEKFAFFATFYNTLCNIPVYKTSSLPLLGLKAKIFLLSPNEVDCTIEPQMPSHVVVSARGGNGMLSTVASSSLRLILSPHSS